jgi:hypothetical protein
MADRDFLIKLTDGMGELAITYCDYFFSHLNQWSIENSLARFMLSARERDVRTANHSAWRQNARNAGRVKAAGEARTRRAWP